MRAWPRLAHATHASAWICVSMLRRLKGGRFDLAGVDDVDVTVRAVPPRLLARTYRRLDSVAWLLMKKERGGRGCREL